MVNLAIVTVALLFLAIPGYVARISYFSGEMSRAVLPRKPFEDIYVAIVFSAFLHAAGILICEGLYHGFGLVPDIDFLKIFRLFTGNFYECGEIKDEDCLRVYESLNWVVEHTYQHGPWIIGYFGLVNLLGGFSGRLLAKRVWEKNWDLKAPALFKFENLWLYRHSGRGYVKHDEKKEFVLPFIHIEVKESEDVSYIFSGWWVTFSTEHDGNLRDLVLLKVKDEGTEEVPEDGQKGKGEKTEEVPKDGEFSLEELLAYLDKSITIVPYSRVSLLEVVYIIVDRKNRRGRFVQKLWEGSFMKD